MKKIVKLTTIILLLFFSNKAVFADTPHFLDFKLILNESDAGKKAQTFLKKKLEGGIKTLKSKENDFIIFRKFFYFLIRRFCK